MQKKGGTMQGYAMAQGDRRRDSHACINPPWQYSRSHRTEQRQVTAAAAFNSSTFDVVAILRLDISDFLLQNTLNIDRASDPD